MEFSSPKIKKFLYFLKKAFLLFWEMELFLREMELFLKTSYISRVNFRSSQDRKEGTVKKVLIL